MVFFDFSVLLIIDVKLLKWNIEDFCHLVVAKWENCVQQHAAPAARPRANVTHAPLLQNKNLSEEDSDDDPVGSRLRGGALQSDVRVKYMLKLAASIFHCQLLVVLVHCCTPSLC